MRVKEAKKKKKAHLHRDRKTGDPSVERFQTLQGKKGARKVSSGLTEWTVSPGGGDVAPTSLQVLRTCREAKGGHQGPLGGPQERGHRVPAGDSFHHKAPKCTGPAHTPEMPKTVPVT